MLKIELENHITDECLFSVNLVIFLAKSNNLDQLSSAMLLSADKFLGVEFGRGGSHMWVTDKRNQKRILLITER